MIQASDLPVRFKIYIPSYNRGDYLKDGLLYELIFNTDFTFVVYRGDGYDFIPDDRKILTPERIEGLLSRKRNWILDTFFDDKTDFIVMIDDDVNYIAWAFGGIYQVEIEYLIRELVSLYQLAMLENSGIFGIRELSKKRMMHPCRTSRRVFYGPSGLISSVLIGIIDKELRYDENLYIREDVDLTLQAIRKYGRIIKSLRWRVATKTVHGFGKGGDRRNCSFDKIAKDNAYLIAKWTAYGPLLHSLLSGNPYSGL